MPPKGKLGLIALAFAVGTALSSAGARAQDVVVAHSAGINGQAVDKILEDFTKETGVKATGVTLSDTDAGAKMQLAARSGNAPYDVVLGMGQDIFSLTQDSGIYATLDTSGWNEKTLAAMKEAKLIGENYAVSQDTAGLLVYGSSLANNPPKTWADFFDTKTFPGNRGMASGGLGVPINMEYALIASGTKPESLYPLDHDKAMEKLDSISDKLVLWDNAPKGIQDLVNGDTTMAWVFGPAALGAIKAGQDIHLVAPEGTAVIRGVGVVMENGPNGKDVANTFMEWWFRPENQKKYTEYTNYGIVVASPAVLATLDPEKSAFLPFSGEHPEYFHTLDYGFYTAEGDLGQSNLAITLEKWNQFRAR